MTPISVSITPKTVVLWAVAAGVAGAIAVAPIAGADPILPTAGNGSASDAIQQLESAGYTVSTNFLQGYPNVPLNECRVQSIAGLPGTTTTEDAMVMLANRADSDTVTVDISCPNAK